MALEKKLRYILHILNSKTQKVAVRLILVGSVCLGGLHIDYKSALYISTTRFLAGNMGHYPHRLQNWHYSYRLHITTLQIDYCHTGQGGIPLSENLPPYAEKGSFFTCASNFQRYPEHPPPQKRKLSFFFLSKSVQKKKCWTHIFSQILL